MRSPIERNGRTLSPLTVNLRSSGVLREGPLIARELTFRVNPDGSTKTTRSSWDATEGGFGATRIVDPRPTPSRAGPTLVIHTLRLATWEKTAQRANAGNPLKVLVSALGLEPKTL